MKKTVIAAIILSLASALLPAVSAPAIYFASDEDLRNMSALRGLPEGSRTAMQNALYRYEGLEAYTIYNGRHSLALVPMKGWGKVEFVRTEGLHPETRFAETINVQAEVSGPTELKTLTLFKKGRFSRADIAAAMKGL